MTSSPSPSSQTSRFCGHFACREDGSILSCNPCFLKLLGLGGMEAALSSNFFAFFPTGKATKAFIAALRANRQLDQIELRLSPPGRDALWVRMAVTSDFNKAGELTGFHAEMLDITRERQLGEQLLQAQKLSALGQLTGGIAHDFNNLLSIITGYSDLLLEELEDHDRLQPLLVEVSRAAERGARMTRQLLSFSRERPVSLALVNIPDTLNGLEKMLRRLIGAQISLDVHCPADLPPVKADVGQLEQTIMNLVINARDAIPDKGSVILRAASQSVPAPLPGLPDEVTPGEYVVLTVEDSGEGMETKVMRRIFEPFFTTKHEQRGTGLGLATCRDIIGRFNGFIQVQSLPGSGTTFRLFIPASTSREQQAAAKPRPQLGTMRGTETVLVVEDDALVRDVIVRVLSINGYSVLHAEDAKAARAELANSSRPVDLLLVDVVLPDVMGPELAAEITAEHPEMLVLFMSGYADRAAEKYGLNKANGNFLPKPFSAVELVTKLRETLDHQTSKSD